jgi:hypothetical protein
LTSIPFDPNSISLGVCKNYNIRINVTYGYISLFLLGNRLSI